MCHCATCRTFVEFAEIDMRQRHEGARCAQPRLGNLTKDQRRLLLAAQNTSQLCVRLREIEYDVAARWKGESREYLDCDEMAVLLSDVLRVWHVPHAVVLGYSDEGSSHCWVRIGESDVDPTEQGFGSGEWRLSAEFDAAGNIVAVAKDAQA